MEMKQGETALDVVCVIIVLDFVTVSQVFSAHAVNIRLLLFSGQFHRKDLICAVEIILSNSLFHVS